MTLLSEQEGQHFDEMCCVRELESSYRKKANGKIQFGPVTHQDTRKNADTQLSYQMKNPEENGKEKPKNKSWINQVLY